MGRGGWGRENENIIGEKLVIIILDTGLVGWFFQKKRCLFCILLRIQDLSPEMEVPMGHCGWARCLGTPRVVLGACCPSHQQGKIRGAGWRLPSAGSQLGSPGSRFRSHRCDSEGSNTLRCRWCRREESRTASSHPLLPRNVALLSARGPPSTEHGSTTSDPPRRGDDGRPSPVCRARLQWGGCRPRLAGAGEDGWITGDCPAHVGWALHCRVPSAIGRPAQPGPRVWGRQVMPRAIRQLPSTTWSSKIFRERPRFVLLRRGGFDLPVARSVFGCWCFTTHHGQVGASLWELSRQVTVWAPVPFAGGLSAVLDLSPALPGAVVRSLPRAGSPRATLVGISAEWSFSSHGLTGNVTVGNWGIDGKFN